MLIKIVTGANIVNRKKKPNKSPIVKSLLLPPNLSETKKAINPTTPPQKYIAVIIVVISITLLFLLFDMYRYANS